MSSERSPATCHSCGRSCPVPLCATCWAERNPSQCSALDEAIDDLARDAFRDLCEGDGQHSEAFDLALLRKHLHAARRLPASPAPEGETPRFRAVVSADYKAGYAKGSEDCRRAAEGRAIIQKAIDRHHQRASPAPTPEGRETASLSREDREQAIQAAYQSAVYACTAKFLKYDERMAEARRLLKLAPKP